jgi:O-antigen/teichoic acid export membrane protein
MLSPEPEFDSGNTLSRAVRRFGWGLGDQALSSLTNFVASLVIARSVSTADLGIFSLAFGTYLIVLGLSRLFSTDPLVIRYSVGKKTEWRRATRAAAGTSATIGLITGMSLAVFGWIIGGSAGTTFVVLGATLPGLLIQDAWRFAFFARSRGLQAFLNDLIWCLVLVVFLAITLSADRRSVAWLMGAWGAAAGIAAIAGMLQAELLPAPRLVRHWYTSNRDLSIPFLGGALIYSIATNMALYLIGVIAGIFAVGSLRAAGVLLGPTTLVVSGLSLVAVPEAARSLSGSPHRLLRTAVGLSCVAAVCSFAWGVLVLSLPTSVGTELLGQNWQEGHALLIPLTIAAVAGASAIGATAGLKALEAAGRILRLRIVGGVIVLTSAIIGAMWSGASGVAMTAAVGETLIAAISWRQLMSALRERRTARKSVL